MKIINRISFSSRWTRSEKMGLFSKKPDIEKLTEYKDIEGLKKALTHKDETVRLSAAYGLSTFADISYLDLFVKTLLTGDFRPKQKLSLDLNNPDLLRPFLRTLKHSDATLRADGKINLDFTPRWGGTLILANSAGAGAVEPLIKLLDDYDYGWAIRGMAIVILSKIGRDAVEPLKAALTHESLEIRRGAAIALGIIGDPGAVEALKAATQDDDEAVKNAAAEALQTIGTG
jgi:HEAT repeat protein